MLKYVDTCEGEGRIMSVARLTLRGVTVDSKAKLVLMVQQLKRFMSQELMRPSGYGSV